jgi:2-amino-4-hydroxy-6-hydroxymethyldihydropteridine diphosphokinase
LTDTSLFTEIILHLGSNTGDRIFNLDKCKYLINEYIGTIERSSSLYETAPWGNTSQGAFLNLALVIRTSLSAEQLILYTQAIETLLGKDIKERWGPRSIDIDILAYGDQIINFENLEIPHPRIHLRNFVLIPLVEIYPDWVHPIIDMNAKTLLDRCEDDGKVILFRDRFA